MAPPKSKDHNRTGLGRAIIHRQAKDAQKKSQSGLYITDSDPTTRLKSVTQERDLDEFLNTAQLAGTEFTAERRNVKIIQQHANPTQNPYLLTETEEGRTLRKHQDHKTRLRVPRRPPWTKSMTIVELDKQEKAAFLDWRRGLAQLQEEEKLLLTPFERNLEVWRQLWRVVERSHLVVQIVDARNPLRFRCEDLENYVHDVEGAEGEAGTGVGKRKTLLLINKADLLTAQQRALWADYFDQQDINYAFFSAAHASASLEEQPDVNSDEEELSPSESSTEGDDYYSAEEQDPSAASSDPRIRVLSVLELQDLFLQVSPPLSDFTELSGQPPVKVIVGLVGYPNVGKSSTINSLLGTKKVSVSSTPGKTKHFQTIHLSDSIMLLDCPGLVFPQFATTKAELVCDGVLPIDQMREYTGPIALVVKRIPHQVLEATYGLTIPIRPTEEGGNGQITAENFLVSHAIARGFMKSGQGNPDEARSARYILKDYVNAKLLFCHPPPSTSVHEFNAETHEIALERVAGKKRAPATRVTKNADTFIANSGETDQGTSVGQKSQTLDKEFFSQNSNLTGRAYSRGQEFFRSKLYPHQNMVGDDGTVLGAQHGRLVAVLSTPSGVYTGKKTHRKPKRAKNRSGKGYDV